MTGTVHEADGSGAWYDGSDTWADGSDAWFDGSSAKGDGQDLRRMTDRVRLSVEVCCGHNQTGNATLSHSESTSTVRDTRNTIASSNGRPTICTLIGNPPDAMPTGTLIAG
jgi:hypothetical protein